MDPPALFARRDHHICSIGSAQLLNKMEADQEENLFAVGLGKINGAADDRRDCFLVKCERVYLLQSFLR